VASDAGTAGQGRRCFHHVPLLEANCFPRMAKYGSPVIKSPGTASLWARLTLLCEGMLESSCMELQ